MGGVEHELNLALTILWYMTHLNRQDRVKDLMKNVYTVAVNKKFTFRIHTTIVLRSVPFIRNLPVLRLLSQQFSPLRVSGQVRRPLSPVRSKLQTRDKRQRIVKAFQ